MSEIGAVLRELGLITSVVAVVAVWLGGSVAVAVAVWQWQWQCGSGSGSVAVWQWLWFLNGVDWSIIDRVWCVLLAVAVAVWQWQCGSGSLWQLTVAVCGN
jgi:hypothetical protein